MVYMPNFRGEASTPAALGPFYISILHYGDLNPSINQIWLMEAKKFGEPLGLSYEVPSSFQYETNEVSVRFDARHSECTVAAALGFCRIPSLYYKEVAVDPDRAKDPVVIRRVLASWFLGPNPLPGLMNPDAPTNTFSLLEEQAIRLILQRPLVNRYPDTDR
jgi:hypothetical protein